MYKKYLVIICSLLVLETSGQAQDFDAKLTEAKISMMEGHYEVGLNQCKELISTGTDSTQRSLAYGYAGLASEVLGYLPDALAYYCQAVSYKVPQMDVYDKLISLSKKEKNDSVYEFALLEKAKAFPEDQPDITKNLAIHYANTQQYEKLLDASNALLNWFPENTNYLFYKAVAYQNLNQVEKAETHYQKVLQLDPEHPGANMSFGLLLFNRGSEVFESRKKEYEAKSRPNRVDYSVYRKGIDQGKALYRQALPYLLKAFESGSYPGLNKALYNIYVRLEENEKAALYR
jgi:tetratricopeptide (TPR) repeat protein